MPAAEQARKPVGAPDSDPVPQADSQPRPQSDAERKAVAALGYNPTVAEVHTLVKAHQEQGLLSSRAEDIGLATAMGRAFASARGAEAYSLLRELRQRGPALDRSLDLIERLYGPGVDIELRAVAAVGGGGSYTWQTGSDRKSALAFLREHDGLRNLYVCIHPRKAGLRGTTKPGNGNDVASRRFMAFDHDNKDAENAGDPGWERATSLLRGMRPVMFVATGNGTHVWFEIEEVTDPVEIAAMTGPLNALMHAVGSDRVGDAARPMRLPFTINIPNERKRGRGAKLALAHPVHGPDPHDKVWPWRDLVREVAGAFGLDPDKLPGKGTGTASKGGAVSTDAMPAEMLRAPNGDLLFAALDLLPNGDGVSRDQYVNIAHAVRGASAGTGFEEEARDGWLRWAGRYFGSDPDEDARVYDTIRGTHRGWPHLAADLRAANPAGWQQIVDRLAPLRQADAQRAFAGKPFPPEQQHLVPDPANDNSVRLGRSSDSKGPDNSPDADPRSTGPRGKSVAQRAVEWLLHAGAEFFHSPNGRTWASVAGRNHSLDSEAGFRTILSRLTVHTDLAITGNAKNELKDLLLNRAYIGAARKVHYRQAQGPDTSKPESFINLMNDDGDGVHVDGTGWRVMPTAAMPVRFTDRAKGLPLPRPVRANDGIGLFDRLGRHVSFHPVQQPQSPTDAGVQQRSILLLFLLNQLYRAGNAVHLFLNAPQGSGKTMTSRRLKDLVDPDTAALVPSLPSDEAVLFAIAEQQTMLALDNLSSMKGDAADLFCGLATGAAQQRRALYTDGDRHVYEALCSVIFNSIREDLIQRADLMDRTAVVDLPPLDRKNRRTEADLNARWEEERPHMLADLLDALSGGLARLEAVRVGTALDDLPRFTDAALLADAAAQSLGWKPGLCLAAINASRRSASDRQLEENPYAFRVRAMLEAEGGEWTGTAADLRDKLRFVDGPDWGRVNQSLSSFTAARDRMAGPLRETWGIQTTPSWKGTNGVRLMRLVAGKTET